MKIRNIIMFTFLLAAVTITSCLSHEQDELREVILPVGYIPNVQFAPYYVAIDKGYYLEEGIDLKLQYGYEIDAVSLVGTGEYPFAVVSGEQVLLAREKGLPVTYVMNWYKDFPIGISVLKDSGIETLDDLRGKKIGIPALQGASYIAYEGLMNFAGLSTADVDLEVIGFTQAEMLSTGKVDAVVIYAANTPVQLRAQGIETNTFIVSDYMHLIGNGIIVNDALMEKDPDFIESIVRATIKGIEFSAKSPEETYEICKKYVENLEENSDGIQYQVLEASIPFWSVETNGATEESDWKTMSDLLKQIGLTNSDIPLDKVYTNEYLP